MVALLDIQYYDDETRTKINLSRRKHGRLSRTFVYTDYQQIQFNSDKTEQLKDPFCEFCSSEMKYFDKKNRSR